MSFQNNPNIIKVTGTVREINGRSFLGRNGVDEIDDVWHFAYIVMEDANGELLKFERVTTNEKIDAEIEVGNRVAYSTTAALLIEPRFVTGEMHVAEQRTGTAFRLHRRQ